MLSTELAENALAHAATYACNSGNLDHAVNRLTTPALVEAQLRKALHSIEKGLSLEQRRRPFGATAERRISELITIARHRYTAPPGSSLADAIAQATRALESLRLWNGSGMLDDRSIHEPSAVGPTSAEARDAIDRLFIQRHSIRSFIPDAPVSDDDMHAAVRTALASPSVCNRATGRVHFYHGPDAIADLFEVQTGNRGLTGVRHVAIVTNSLEMFTGPDEYAQPWIDGGIFAMNLVWGFEQQGIGTCFLNWSMSHGASVELRRIAGIPEEELIITMIAFGHPVPEFRVTTSAKPPVDTIVTHHRG